MNPEDDEYHNYGIANDLLNDIDAASKASKETLSHKEGLSAAVGLAQVHALLAIFDMLEQVKHQISLSNRRKKSTE